MKYLLRRCINILQSDLEWCESSDTVNGDTNPDYKRGYIEGLKHAKTLINEVDKED